MQNRNNTNVDRTSTGLHQIKFGEIKFGESLFCFKYGFKIKFSFAIKATIHIEVNCLCCISNQELVNLIENQHHFYYNTLYYTQVFFIHLFSPVTSLSSEGVKGAGAIVGEGKKVREYGCQLKPENNL